MSDKNSKEKITDPEEQPAEKKLEATLRPKNLKEYVGQSKIKQNLDIFMQAAKKRGEPIEHVLFYGAPGLGKTTLSHIIAREMDKNIRVTSGPALQHSGDLAAILTNLEDGDILFIDEIHRLNRQIEEVLYPAMEEYALDLIVGKGPSAKTLRIELPHFTLIGATTKVSSLSSPLRDRFGATFHLNFYEPEEIQQIIDRSAKILNIALETEAAEELAKRARRTPRIANRLLKRVRDFCQVHNINTMNFQATIDALELLAVDEHGLDDIDRKILEIIIDKFKGGPVGLNTMAAASGEEMSTIEDVYEPFLIQSGFLHRTAKGRMATERAYELLGVKNPNKQNPLI
ncbi:MAG: Holliday junction branch migration DNA helicase RuvB [Candidatus Buchananbacteria bacterium CG10_big_fil_rev_8_21_14_0_10_42_9]|uniref:Holliday junction branch migration complex subunit RuvB n=1 Tax=Candidatus Buchananbacteria bacterium CG10_big_fil_rev_8_21_14_0_10_42_9 TaxID=1974526 RepID=A0A2H0W2B8_9BACT|nr:MAG: Holliday junction branch migration DNA helicase RuvB [Candidatus Buchananbacteria bacterium CG10_big_fil_rev_8_21_14_0_10_42_9]